MKVEVYGQATDITVIRHGLIRRLVDLRINSVEPSRTGGQIGTLVENKAIFYFDGPFSQKNTIEVLPGPFFAFEAVIERIEIRVARFSPQG